MKKYDYIFFDIDDTLLDYYSTEQQVLIKIFKYENQKVSNHTLKNIWKISCDLWEKYDLNNSNNFYVQKNYHTLFYQYIFEFMGKLKEQYNFKATTIVLKNLFIDYMKYEVCPFDETETILKKLANISTLIIASNGLTEIQQKRIEKYKDYFSDVFISESLGIIKPSMIFWDKIFKNLDTQPQNCLMVGDSLNNDISGALIYGMDTCWINRNKKKNMSKVAPTYEIDNLEILLEKICFNDVL